MSLENELKIIFGDERVSSDAEELSSFSTDSSFIKGEIPEFIVKPKDIEEIKKLVKLSNDKGIALVPCSSGGTRNKGDTVPLRCGSIVVDLSDMKSIIRIDKRNKVAMIEPGVTFSDLQAAGPDKEGLRLEMPMLPKKNKSVVASLLDREPTTGPKYNWDANDPLCCMELVFGSGDMFRTGNVAGPGTIEEQWAAGQAQKVSMGPAQTDIGRLIQGSQGALGIVTWATTKLELKPTLNKAFLVAGESLDELTDFAYKIMWRKLPDVCLILNSSDLAAILKRDESACPRWTLLYTISGLEYFPEERIDFLEKDITEIAAEFSVKPLRNVSGISADALAEIIHAPSDEPYWKAGKKSAYQDVFFLTTLDRAGEFIIAVKEKAAENEFPTEDLGVYVQPIRHGTGCHLEFTLMYDPDQQQETEKAENLFEALSSMCLDMGGFFSRPYDAWADMVYEKCPDTALALGKIKNIFDPNGVLNPGRLCFRKEA